jgi:biopolymer transport protein TolQ
MSSSNRIDRNMEVTISREIEVMEKGMTFLASVGSVAPFVGLFGTVWGIMNSFQAIAMSKNTSLAVVAPGIAEALFATALGLVAAIPAVVAYNRFNARIDALGARVDRFSSEFSSMLSRQLEEE